MRRLGPKSLSDWSLLVLVGLIIGLPLRALSGAASPGAERPDSGTEPARPKSHGHEPARSCGAVALFAALRLAGFSPPEPEQLAEEVGREELSLQDLVTLARRFTPKAEAVFVRSGRISDVPTPAVLHVELEARGGHYLTLVLIEEPPRGRPAAVYIDGSTGALLRMPLGNLERIWTGYAVVLGRPRPTHLVRVVLVLGLVGSGAVVALLAIAARRYRWPLATASAVIIAAACCVAVLTLSAKPPGKEATAAPGATPHAVLRPVPRTISVSRPALQVPAPAMRRLLQTLPQHLPPDNVEALTHLVRLAPWLEPSEPDKPSACRAYFEPDSWVRYLGPPRTSAIAVRSHWGVRHFVGNSVRTHRHPDQFLAALAEIGTPIERPVLLDGAHEAPLHDWIMDSLARFSPEQELEWTTIVVALYTRNGRWRDRFGRQWELEELCHRLLSQQDGACFGTHRLYALAVALNVGKREKLLGRDTLRQIRGVLTEASERLAKTQKADGYWCPTEGTGSDGSDALLSDCLRLTAHHLEWLAVAGEEIPIDPTLVRRSLGGLDRLVDAVPSIDYGRFYAPLSHALRAWLLWTDPEALNGSRSTGEDTNRRSTL